MALLIRTLLAALLLLSAQAHADNTLQLAEQEIKAGLLYNFLKYTDWPGASMEKSPAMNVCILGSDPFAGYLQPMAGRTVNQRGIILRKVQNMQEMQSCHLLFINARAKDSWPQLKVALKGKAVLTVSDFDGFANSGGMIEFGRKNDHISVNLNMDAVTSGGLRVQDRLLRLVTLVHPGEP